MVNNNGIPFEVKKPTETVYEIKDEYKAPSFGEFMKNYENDGKVNYDDLSSGSVGEAKGYGPCYVCYKPEDWTYLKVSCQVSGCSDKDPGYWYHNRDGCRYTRMRIWNRGKLECGNCHTTRQVGCWLFICSNHGGTPESISPSSFRKALSIVLASDEDDEVITDLGAYIGDPKHKNEWFN